MGHISFNNWEKEFRQNYYMYIPLTIVLLSCLGAVVAMKVLAGGVTLLSGLELTLIVAICIGYTGILYAGVNKKIIFWWLLIGIAVCILLFIVHLF